MRNGSDPTLFNAFPIKPPSLLIPPLLLETTAIAFANIDKRRHHRNMKPALTLPLAYWIPSRRLPFRHFLSTPTHALLNFVYIAYLLPVSVVSLPDDADTTASFSFCSSFSTSHSWPRHNTYYFPMK